MMSHHLCNHMMWLSLQEDAKQPEGLLEESFRHIILYRWSQPEFLRYHTGHNQLSSILIFPSMLYVPALLPSLINFPLWALLSGGVLKDGPTAHSHGFPRACQPELLLCPHSKTRPLAPLFGTSTELKNSYFHALWARCTFAQKNNSELSSLSGDSSCFSIWVSLTSERRRLQSGMERELVNVISYVHK